MRNARLDEAQAGIKIAGRNINNLRYADDITLMAETEDELKSLLMKVKEENEKAGLKLNIQNMKIMASGPISSVQLLSCVRLFATPWIAARQASLSITKQIDGETIEIVTGFIFLGSKINMHGDSSHKI